jgi:hypothetical protein
MSQLQEIDVAKFLYLAGIKFSEKEGRMSILCPFHDDTRPSASVYKDTQRFHCFKCDLHLDLISFYAKLHKVSRDQACKILSRLEDPETQEKNRIEEKENKLSKKIEERLVNKLKPYKKCLGMVLYAKMLESIDASMWCYSKKELPFEDIKNFEKKWEDKLQEILDGRKLQVSEKC